MINEFDFLNFHMQFHCVASQYSWKAHSLHSLKPKFLKIKLQCQNKCWCQNESSGRYINGKKLKRWRGEEEIENWQFGFIAKEAYIHFKVSCSDHNFEFSHRSMTWCYRLLFVSSLCHHGWYEFDIYVNIVLFLHIRFDWFKLLFYFFWRPD